MEAVDRRVNRVMAGNRNWTVSAARKLRNATVQSLPEQVRSPLPPWDNVHFRELFYFLLQRAGAMPADCRATLLVAPHASLFFP